MITYGDQDPNNLVGAHLLRCSLSCVSLIDRVKGLTRGMGPGTSPPRRVTRRTRQTTPPSMSRGTTAGPASPRLTNNPQPPPTGRVATRLAGAATLVPIVGNIHAYPSDTPPPPRPLVNCADLVNEAAFLDQYGSRTPPLRGVLRTPQKTKKYTVRKVFGLPQDMQSVSVEGTRQTRVASLASDPLTVRIDPATPWAPMLVDGAPFPIGSVQKAVAEGAATKYNAPGLAHIGGFFYHAVPKRTAVRCPVQIMVGWSYGNMMCIC